MTFSVEAPVRDASFPSHADVLGKDVVRVAKKDCPADGVVRLTLVHPSGGRLADWTPGSHIDVVVPQPDGTSTTRQYSLCGDRWDAHSYQIAVLREPGSRGGSIFLHDELAEGDLLRIGTPRNHFLLAPAKRLEFIAGGIGITPIMAMIDAAERLETDWRLLYGGRTRSSMAFVDELARYGDRVLIRPQDEYGLLDLSAYTEPVEGSRVYTCGPAPLIAAVEAATTKWPDGTVRFERFSAVSQAPPVRSGSFSVELARSGKTITVTPQVSVLQALAEAGSPVLASCAQGLCGTCEVRVVDGVPDHRDSLLSDAERDQNDRMFVCVSRAVTERLVLDL